MPVVRYGPRPPREAFGQVEFVDHSISIDSFTILCQDQLAEYHVVDILARQDLWKHYSDSGVKQIRNRRGIHASKMQPLQSRAPAGT